jgi:hypothetical protein
VTRTSSMPRFFWLTAVCWITSDSLRRIPAFSAF